MLCLCGVLVALVTLCACTAVAPVEPASSQRQAITNGTVDTRDPAVVALLGADGTMLCSGALISAVVLTAAHCLYGATRYVSDQVLFGGAVASGGTAIAVSGVAVHPQYDPTTLANDLAHLALAAPAPRLPRPAPVAGERRCARREHGAHRRVRRYVRRCRATSVRSIPGRRRSAPSRRRPSR